MPRPESNRERREKAEKFQTFNRPKLKIARNTASGTTYIDYKDTESLKKMMSGNGKISVPQAHRRQCDGAAHARPGHQAGPLHGPAPVREHGGLNAPACGKPNA